jgi:predicted nuclease of predicted toxin-antitoxin system
VKVKLDENLGQSHAKLVRDAGHVAQRVTEQGLSGAKDPVLWQHVCDTGRFFVTLDLDFSDVRRFVPGTHPGILLIRPRGKGREAVARVVRRVLAEHGLEPLVGCLAVADESRTRIRRPPATSEESPSAVEEKE